MDDHGVLGLERFNRRLSYSWRLATIATMPWREHGMVEPGGTGVCGISSMILSTRNGTDSVRVVEEILADVLLGIAKCPSQTALHAAALLQESARSEAKSFPLQDRVSYLKTLRAMPIFVVVLYKYYIHESIPRCHRQVSKPDNPR